MAPLLTINKNYPKYKDFWVKACGSFLCAHAIEVLGRDESMLLIMTKRFYYIDVGSGFLIAFLVWTLLSQMIRWLDKHFDWNSHTLQRSFLQFFLGILLPSFAVHVLTYLQGVYIIEDSSFFTPTWPNYEFPLCIMLIILINAYYLLYYYYLEVQRVKNLTSTQASSQPTFSDSETPLKYHAENSTPVKKLVLLVTKGYKTYPLPVSTIAYIFKEDRYSYIMTFEGEKYFIDHSLEEIILWLEDKIFFKVNRKTIIHINACKCFSPFEHGKLELSLIPVPDFQVLVSQKTAPVFKEWMNR